MDLPIYTLKSRITLIFTTLQFVNVSHRREMHMKAQSTRATDIAFKGRQRYRISEHHDIMYSINT